MNKKVEELNKSKVTNNIYIHAISDGRDSDKWSLIDYIKKINR